MFKNPPLNLGGVVLEGIDNPEVGQQIRKAEHLQRLVEINKQLNQHFIKKEAQTRGNAVLLTLMSGAFGAGAAQDGEQLQQFTEHLQGWQQFGVGALVGGSVGYGLLTLARAVRARKVNVKNQFGDSQTTGLQADLRKNRAAVDKLWATQGSRKRGEDVRPL